MSPTYFVCHTLSRLAAHCLLDYKVEGAEHLIEDGPALIVSNHVSYLDPPLVGIAYRKQVAYLARKTLFRGFGAWLYPRLGCVPVDQEGSDFSALKNVIKLLKEGHRVILFPEGARSFDGQLQVGQPGVGLVIAKAQVPVQPLRIFGAHEILPPGAGMPALGGKVKVVVGKPIHFAPERLASKSKDLYQELATECMEAIGALKLDA